MDTSPTTKGTEEVEDLRRLLHHIVDNHTDPGLLLELLYFGAEPDLLNVIRAYIGMSPKAQNVLGLFFDLAQDRPESISAAVHANGDLTLSSPASVGLAELIARGAVPQRMATPVQ